MVSLTQGKGSVNFINPSFHNCAASHGNETGYLILEEGKVF